MTIREGSDVPQQHEASHSTFAIRKTLWDTALKSCGHANGSVSIPYEPRLPESPHVEMIWRGGVENDSVPLCPADVLWYMRFLKRDGITLLTLHGPTTKVAPVAYQRGDEFLGIRFKPGVFMPHLPPGAFVDSAIELPQAARGTCWLGGATWEVPAYENADIFIDHLIRADLLQYDPVVAQVLSGHAQELAQRSVQMRFLRATGLSRKVIQQIERVRYAAALLNGGARIIDVVAEAGYFDQPHLTRSLKRFLGKTPTQLAISRM